MNILVTGGCGFIGSHFVNHIFNKCEHLINLDAMYYCASLHNVNEDVRKSSKYTFIHGNLQSFDLLRHIFKTYKITHIVHFAAQSHVQNSFDDSIQYTKDNILGSHNLLECVRLFANDLQKFVFVSTDEVYGESHLNDTLEKNEQSILCPTNPYAATKAAAELLAKSYNISFNIPIIITRGNNVYGPNQYPEKLIPKFVELLKENKKVTIQGDGTQLRSFLHVSDVVNGFEIILDNGVIGEIYNIGGDMNSEISVMDIAKLLIKKIQNTDNYNEWISYIEDRPFNDKRYFISNKKLKSLGWNIQKPNLDLSNII